LHAYCGPTAECLLAFHTHKKLFPCLLLLRFLCHVVQVGNTYEGESLTAIASRIQSSL
jgi:hypothetical protein